jgi:hypothetical protein
MSVPNCFSSNLNGQSQLSATGQSIANINLNAGIAQVRAIAGAITLNPSQSGQVFTVDQGASYTITLPVPTACAGCAYTFLLVNPAANTVIISGSGASTVLAIIVQNGVSLGATLRTSVRYLTGAALANDLIKVSSNGVFWDALCVSAGAAAVSFGTA